jgi:hypothetical protein
MLITIYILFILSSIVWLILGIRGKKEVGLIILNGVWWLGSFATAYATYLAWQDRAYSENWAMVGFIFFALPYLIIIGVMVVIELYYVRNWQSSRSKTVQWTSRGLLIFLAFQMILGFLSA